MILSIYLFSIVHFKKLIANPFLISLRRVFFHLCLFLVVFQIVQAKQTILSNKLFILRDGSFAEACEAPFYQVKLDNDQMLCDICKSGSYLYPDGKCYEQCSLPFISRTEKNFKFCESLCSEPRVLYNNGSCFDKCEPPFELRTEKNIQICKKPCHGEILFWDNSCVQTCEFPYKESVRDDVKTCQLPCKNKGEYYFIEEDLCRIECEGPYLTKEIGTIKMCYSGHMLIKKEAGTNIKVYAILSKLGQFFTGVGVTVANAIGSSNPASFSLAGFIKMLPYIRYMEINYPERLLETLQNNANSSLISFNFGPKMPLELKEKFTKYPLPGRFDEYQLHSSFLVNYWQIFTALGIILLAVIVLALMTWATKKKAEILNNIFKKIKLIVHWNFFLIIFCTNLDGVVLYTSMEMRTFRLDSAGGIVSFVICILMNLFTVFIFGLVFYIIVDLRRKRRQTIVPEEKIPQKRLIPWEKLQLFYKGSKDNKWYRHFYMLIFMTRIYLFNAIIAYLFDYPFLQAILITAMSVFMLIYIGSIRPFVSKVVFCQSMTDEGILFVMNTCMLTLASLDYVESDSESSRNSLGDMIIATNVAISFSALFYMIVYIVQGIMAALNAIRVHKVKGLLSILLIFLAPFEAGGMDMDLVPNGSSEAKEEKPKDYTHIATTSPTEDIKIQFPKSFGSGERKKLNKQSSIVFDTELTDGSRNFIPSTGVVNQETLRSISRKNRIRKLTKNANGGSMSEQNLLTSERKLLMKTDLFPEKIML